MIESSVTCAGNYAARKPSYALLTLRLVAMLCCDLLAWSLLTIVYRIDANPQSGPEDHVKEFKVDCI